MKPTYIKYSLSMGVDQDKLESDLEKEGFRLEDRGSKREYLKFIMVSGGHHAGDLRGTDLFVNPYTDKLEDNELIKFLDSYNQSKS